MRVRLVINPRARRAPESADAVRAALALRGITCLENVEDPSMIDAIVVAGGDGTVVSQIEYAMANQLPIGVIPLGTFNDMAHTLEIPFTIDAACEAIASGISRPIDVGRVNGTYFVNEASIGMSARIARRQTDDVKRRFGVLGIIGTTLAALAHILPFGVKIAYGNAEERFRTIQMTIANSNRFGGIWNIPNTAIDDGLLDLYGVTLAGVRHRSSPWFHVSTGRKHRIVADGEPAGTTPARFEVLPAAIRVFVPTRARGATGAVVGTL